MAEVKPFKTGDILFREGEPCGHVIRIISGKVEVSRLVNGHAIVLGVVEQQQFVGEMAALEERIHSATVRAASDGEAEIIETKAFLNRVSHSPALARELLQRLSIRLRRADDELARYHRPAPMANVPSDARPRMLQTELQLAIRAKTPALQMLIGQDNLVITKLPFAVGRNSIRGEFDPERQSDLSIQDQVPFRLSRHHFRIERRGDNLMVRDLASHLGTNVNGQAIGAHFPSDCAVLQVGENQIVAGGWGSSFEFVVMVEPILDQHRARDDVHSELQG